MDVNRRVAALAAAVGLAFLLAGTASAQHYTRTDLTTDSSSVSSAPNVDPNLVNPWGMSRGSGSPWWLSDNGAGLSTLYDGTGAIQSLVVSIPRAKGGKGLSSPTGTVFNFTTSFRVGPQQPALFLFTAEDGTISGWNPNVNLGAAVQKISRPLIASYKGLAIAMTEAGPRLYATNFKSGEVDVFDGEFHQIPGPVGFHDDSLPPHYAPFGIQNVGGNLVVTFAQRNPGAEDENDGPGLGYVRVFDVYGHLLLRLEHGMFLNAPWGIALAPSDFGPFSHRLLIGNFGDGTIHAFNAVSGKFEGTLLDPTGVPLAIEGLWGLSFGGDGAKNGLATVLYFTAGPNDEGDGIFGNITATAAEQRGNAE
ncbi:MAG TPA: TIGR03118 family protein [Verrucomicrobiae bacterium]|nr:TIGR03118 family protein [Verrucomicrobiae bacterium]